MIKTTAKTSNRDHRNPTKNIIGTISGTIVPNSRPEDFAIGRKKDADFQKVLGSKNGACVASKQEKNVSSEDREKEIENEDLDGQEKENADPRQRVGILGYRNAQGADVDAAEFTDVDYYRVAWRIGQALADDEVSSGTLVNVLIGLAISMQGDDEVGITQQDLATLSRVSKRTVWLRVSDAVALGYVSVDPKADKNQGTGANIYRATDKWIPQDH